MSSPNGQQRPDVADVARGIRQLLDEFASQGVTSMREAMTGTIAAVSEIAMLHQLNGAQRLPVYETAIDGIRVFSA